MYMRGLKYGRRGIHMKDTYGSNMHKGIYTRRDMHTEETYT